MRALLDVDALIALIDDEHIHHVSILDWLNRDENLPHGFATCAITQLGLIRIMGASKYTQPKPAHVVAEQFQRLTRKAHRYLDIPPPCGGAVQWKGLRSAQSTDAALLSTAVAHGCRLVTFDRSIKLGCVSGARREHLVVLA